MAKSRIWGTETPEPIATKFCMPGAVQDVITPANFCEETILGALIIVKFFVAIYNEHILLVNV